MKVSVWLASLALVCLAAFGVKPAAAQIIPTPSSNNEANASIPYFSNIGALTPLAYLEVTSGGNAIAYFNPPSASVSAGSNGGAGESKTKGGNTYARLMNNTASAITLSAPAKIGLNASVTLRAQGYCAAVINLGAATTSASSYGLGATNSEPCEEDVDVTDLQPGGMVQRMGSFSLGARVDPAGI